MNNMAKTARPVMTIWSIIAVGRVMFGDGAVMKMATKGRWLGSVEFEEAKRSKALIDSKY